MSNWTAQELGRLRGYALAASQQEWQIGVTPPELDMDGLINYMAETYRKREPTQAYLVFYGDSPNLETNRVESEVMHVAITGNGPTSEANAEYLVSVQPKNILSLIQELEYERSVSAYLSRELFKRGYYHESNGISQDERA